MGPEKQLHVYEEAALTLHSLDPNLMPLRLGLTAGTEHGSSKFPNIFGQSSLIYTEWSITFYLY
jgi:hypothetical protein